MQQNIDTVLAYEIKKELADRYFGFRKLIEEDIREYDNHIVASSLRLEEKIGWDLVRLYILLKDEELIHQFFRLTGLHEMIFYDPYLVESPTLRKRVLAGQKVHGLTNSGCFKNLVISNYESLAVDIDEYRENLMKIAQEYEDITEEIKIFQQKHDIGTIMDFLRSLDGDSSFKSGSMEGGLYSWTEGGLEQKMKVKPPSPVDKLLPMIPQIPSLKTIKKELKVIINKAYQLHENIVWKDIIRS